MWRLLKYRLADGFFFVEKIEGKRVVLGLLSRCKGFKIEIGSRNKKEIFFLLNQVGNWNIFRSLIFFWGNNAKSRIISHEKKKIGGRQQRPSSSLEERFLTLLGSDTRLLHLPLLLKK